MVLQQTSEFFPDTDIVHSKTITFIPVYEISQVIQQLTVILSDKVIPAKSTVLFIR